MSGMKTMKMVLSQLTCLYQLLQVMGVSAMCTFLGSYLEELDRRGT